MSHTRENRNNSEQARFLCCPCPLKSELICLEDSIICANNDCIHHAKPKGFHNLGNVPILISFDKCDTICRPNNYIDNPYSQTDIYIKRERNQFISYLKLKLYGKSKITTKNCNTFIKLLSENDSPRLLVIGSGTKGSGTELLWENDKIDITGIDIYPSNTTTYIADAHYLPFKDGVFDGVWIQAVLEHVADPHKVVEEIKRVLKNDGMVYAETPFMQQVHEAAYDFQRFTVLGHRYLFKSFELIEMGGNRGAGVVLGWSIKYFMWAFLRNKFVATIISLPFSILFRFLDKTLDKRALYDSSSGVFFLGRKNTLDIKQNELPSLYEGLQ